MNFKSLGIVCPYCFNQLSEEYNFCCSEAGHGHEHFIKCDSNGVEDDLSDPVGFDELPKGHNLIQEAK